METFKTTLCISCNDASLHVQNKYQREHMKEIYKRDKTKIQFLILQSNPRRDKDLYEYSTAVV